MSKQRIVMSFAALALGTVLVSAPALAQTYGRPANDGGQVSLQPGTTQQQQLYNSVPQDTAATAPHYGRPENDGGLVNEPAAAQKAASARAGRSSLASSRERPHYGRPLNDGGM